MVLGIISFFNNLFETSERIMLKNRVVLDQFSQRNTQSQTTITLKHQTKQLMTLSKCLTVKQNIRINLKYQ